jgi:hypothetical protein
MECPSKRIDDTIRFSIGIEGSPNSFNIKIGLSDFTNSAGTTSLFTLSINFPNFSILPSTSFLLPFFTKPNFSLELWVNNNFFGYTHENNVLNSATKKINYNIFYKKFFNIVLKKLKFNISVNKLAYYDEDILTRYDLLPNKYKEFDILILNSQPHSGQYDYNKSSWDNYIIELNSQFKILTTTKVDGVLCTYDDKLTIKDIASLSTKAKIIIAINSGVVPGLLNYYTLTNVKRFYIFDNRCFYSYPNFENRNHITDISFDELRKYLNCDVSFGITIDNIIE